MKKIIIILFSVLFYVCTAQTTKTTTSPIQSAHELKVDSLLAEIDTLLMINNKLLEQLDIDLSLKDRYKMYQTENIYNLLRLDTKTGQIKQVQWSLDSEDEVSVTINGEDLSWVYGYGSGSFELYPTKNMYQFILIDQTDGRMWHVQWGMENSKRWIRRIY